MIVLDASAAVEYLLGARAHEGVTARVERARGVVHAPELLDLEVLQALRRYARAHPPSAVEPLLRDYFQLRIVRHGHRRLAARAWALRNTLTIYDATYVALAEALDTPLITCDARLAAAPGHTATIELIA